jgi:hypothetical protein
MLSAAKHLAFSVAYQDQILRLAPLDDIATQSPTGEDRGEGAIMFWIKLLRQTLGAYLSSDLETRVQAVGSSGEIDIIAII